MKFLTENTLFSTPAKALAGMGGSIIAAISPTMQDAQWWVSFVIGSLVGLLSALSLGIGIWKQLQKRK
jgi:hypothetical protein